MCDEGGGYEEEGREEGEECEGESRVVACRGSCGGFCFGLIGLFWFVVEKKKGRMCGV